jgi:hypothetical protein
MKTHLILAASILALALSSSAHADDGRWRTVEAENGAVYEVDMSTIQAAGGATAVFFYAVEGSLKYPHRFFFDCRGHFMSESSGWNYAPPHSIAGEIGAIACARVKPPCDALVPGGCPK